MSKNFKLSLTESDIIKISENYNKKYILYEENKN